VANICGLSLTCTTLFRISSSVLVQKKFIFTSSEFIFELPWIRRTKFIEAIFDFEMQNTCTEFAGVNLHFSGVPKSKTDCYFEHFIKIIPGTSTSFLCFFSGVFSRIEDEGFFLFGMFALLGMRHLVDATIRGRKFPI
jgi:hypothetical protein